MPRHTWPARWEMIKIKKMAKSGDQISLHFLYLLMPKILTPIPGFGITKRSLSALGIFCCQSLIVSLGTLFFLIFLSLSVMMPCTHVWCQSQSISCFFFLIFLSLGVMMRNTHVWCKSRSISWYFVFLDISQARCDDSLHTCLVSVSEYLWSQFIPDKTQRG